ncbi:uncharacterized protein PAC_02233 [Phialocephala subalpina]|uniref:RNA ligase domain-containing protein n=1 Tax=Phialocephala subalpina TaxID=576137 RepID=A0A1L7WHW7_9HELO|nr:uncharacterized protein PAC_02233 [Phialocephala subalpina]
MGDITPTPELTTLPNISILALEDETETTPKPEERPSTLFPKIGKLDEFIENYKYYIKNRLPPSEEKPTTIQLTGTVKLHGTHADLVIYHNDEIRLQSRNRLSLDMECDNYDCAKHVLPKTQQILKLRDEYAARYRELNGKGSIEKEWPIIIAGEWCGPMIQKSVALADLPRKMFVILGANINNSWVPNEKYTNIHNEEHGFYNIARAGFYHEELDIKNEDEGRLKMMNLTLDVERECPFAKTFGISGIGEGIVWKVAHPLGAGPRFWFKTKGPLHRVSNTDSLAKDQKMMFADARIKAKAFAEASVGEMRLEQGWDYLGEMGKERNKSATQDFVAWLCNDVEVEEKAKIDEMGVNRKLLKTIIGVIGREWYFKRIAE